MPAQKKKRRDLETRNLFMRDSKMRIKIGASSVFSPLFLSLANKKITSHYQPSISGAGRWSSSERLNLQQPSRRRSKLVAKHSESSCFNGRED